MATDVEVYNLVASERTDLEKRIAMRIHKLARDVVNEEPTTDNHANRLLWAAEVFADPMAMARQMKWDIMSDRDAYAAEAPDSASDESWREAKIEASASGRINTYATG